MVFDSSGNPTTFKGTTQSFNRDNQQTGTGFAYDGNGSPTTYKGTTLTFDPENRMTGLGSSWSASYRADGLRASKTVSGTTTYYMYDGGEPVCEFNSSGTLIAYNVFAPDGLVARRKTLVPTWTEYTFDQQGNVAQRLDASQNIITSSYYDAYGVENTTGTPTDQFGYNGRSGYFLDRETGLYLCQHRYFDPAGGRWITRDPIGYAGGINVYGYCGSGPVGWADADGYKISRLAIESGATIFDAVAVLDVLSKLAATTTDGPNARDILYGDNDYELTVSRGGTGSAYDPTTRHMHIDPGQAESLYYYSCVDDKWYVQGLTRNVAHETGHVDVNFLTGASEQDNVDRRENPTMRELGDAHDRGAYGATTRRGFFGAIAPIWLSPIPQLPPPDPASPGGGRAR